VCARARARARCVCVIHTNCKYNNFSTFRIMAYAVVNSFVIMNLYLKYLYKLASKR